MLQIDTDKKFCQSDYVYGKYEYVIKTICYIKNNKFSKIALNIIIFQFELNYFLGKKTENVYKKLTNILKGII